MASVMPKNIYSVIGDTISLNSTNGSLNVSNFLALNSTITNLTVSLSTVTNILATNISSSSFIGTNTTITNAVHTSLSTGTLNLTTLTTSSLLATTRISSASIQGTNSTITNSVHTALSTGTLNLTSAIASSGITTGTLLATNNISTGQLSSTNLSTNTSNITASTIGTLNVTGTSTLQNITATNQTISVLIATTGITTGTLLATTSISSASIQGTNSTITNSVHTALSTGTLNLTSAIASSGITTGTLLATNNISTGQLSSTNLSTNTSNITASTIGALNVTGTSTLQNITATNQTISVLIATTGITTGTLLATSNVSTGQLLSTNISTGTINASTGITSASLLVTGQITSGQLASANISTTNLYVTTLITGSNLGVSNLTTGTLRVSSTRGILIGSSTDIDTARMISALNNTLSSGGQNYITLGHSASTNNQSEFSFVYFTSGSTLNRTSIGLFGNPNMFNILGTGNVGIGNTNPSYKLDTTGDIRATGNIFVGGGFIYPNTNTTASTNLSLNVFGGTLSINGPTNLSGYGINASGTSTLGNIVSIGGGNVGIGVASPNSIFQVGTSVDGIYGNNPLASNSINIFGAARASPTYSGTSDMNGTIFVNSTSTYGRNVGASIALGGRGNNFGAGNLHMTFARINGVQANDRDNYDGNFVIETQSAGAMYERLRILQNGNIGIGMTGPAYLLDVNGTIDAIAYTGGSVSVSGNITNGGFDFILGTTDQTARGNSGLSRALVKNAGSVLQINHAGDFTGGTEVQGNFFRTLGNSNTIGNIITTGGNVGIGTSTPEGRFQVVLPPEVNSGWRNLTFRGTSLWGDGITTYNAAGVYTSGTLYGTIMNVMLCNPHITSDFGDTARMRFGRARGIASGAFWETGVKTDGSWHISQSGVNNNFIITTGGNIGIGLAAPTQIMQMQRSGSDNYLKIDAGGAASNFSGIMLTEHNLNWGWSLRHDAGTDLLYISYQDNTPSFTNTTIFNRSGQIGINKTPAYTLDINGNRLNIHNAAGTGGGQNLFEGLENTNIRAQIVLSSMYSDLVIASSQANDNHGSTLTFASYNPSNKADYRKWVINQGNWGARVHMLEFGYNPNNEANPHIAIGDTYTTMTLDGTNKRVGISNRSPGFKLDVNGDFRAYGGRYIIQNGQDGGTGRGIYMWAEGDTNWAIYMGQSGAGRSFSGGTATTGVYGFAAHAVRFRVANSTTNGWIFENGGEGHAASIRSDGHMYIAGNLGIGTVSPSYKLHVSGDTLTNGWFRTTGDTGLWSDTYSRGMRVAVSGDYGNIETHGAGKNDWEGFSIDGRYVFMSSDVNNCGIYNDVDNHWITYWDRPNGIYKICHDTAKNTSIGDGGGYVQVCGGGGQFYVGGNRGGAFMRLNDDMWFSDPQNGTIEIKNGGNNNWGTLVGYFNNQCSRESKKNIVKFEEEELNNLYNDTISTDVYEFHYKEDQDTDKKKIGIILEESPDYMCVTPDGKSLYNLSYITMLHGAIKVLDKKVKELESENTTLKSQIQQIFTHLGL